MKGVKSTVFMFSYVYATTRRVFEKATKMDLDALPGPTEEQLKELDPNEVRPAGKIFQSHSALAILIYLRSNACMTQEDDSRVLRITAPYEDCSERFQLKVRAHGRCSKCL